MKASRTKVMLSSILGTTVVVFAACDIFVSGGESVDIVATKPRIEVVPATFRADFPTTCGQVLREANVEAREMRVTLQMQRAAIYKIARTQGIEISAPKDEQEHKR